MGYSLTTIVGCYALIHCELIRYEEKLVCKNHPNSKYKLFPKEKFCSVCGQELETIKVESDSKHKDLYDIFNDQEMEEYEDMMYTPEYLSFNKGFILLGNMGDDGNEYIKQDEYSEINTERMYDSITKFKNIYGKLLEVLDSKDCVPKIEIKYGIANYNS